MSRSTVHPRDPARSDGSVSHRAALGLALFVTLLWSSSWVLIRWGLDDEALPPLSFAALRYALAAIVLLVWVAGRPHHRDAIRGLDRKTVRNVALLGVVLYAVTQGAQFVAIDSQPAATTSLVLSATPMLVAAISTRTLAERAAPNQVVGAMLVAVGATLFFSGDLGVTAVGLTAAFIALLANSIASVAGRAVNRSTATTAVVVTALSMAVGASVLLVVAVAIEGVPDVSARAWGLIAWLAVVNTALAFTLWNLSLRRLSALESAGINNTMLLQIALLAWLLLDEPPGLLGLAGIVVVSAGIFLTQRRH